jgi:hypothetical protein
MRPNSIQLTIAEWIEVGEALERHVRDLRREARRILDDVIANVESVDTDSEIDRLVVEAAKHSIKRDWHVLDEKVAELIGQASDEIARFVTTQEIRVRSLDRQLHSGQLHSDSGQNDRSDRGNSNDKAS